METSYPSKPYFFAPLAKNTERKSASSRQDLLSADNKAGKLRIDIKCATPLHFGSGQLIFDEKNEIFIKSLIRENGKIALPGSSFKGMLRTFFEAVTGSCVLNAPKSLPEKVGNISACSDRSGVCPACSVFGRLSYKGKLIIGSFYTDNTPVHISVPLLEQPFKTYPRPLNNERDTRLGNERLYYGNFRGIHGLDVARMSKSEFWANKKREPRSNGNFYGRKFYKHSHGWERLAKEQGRDKYECLPVGAVLTGSLSYQGLTDDELGALLFSLGLGWGHPIYHKLGYAKPAFLGSVMLTITPAPLSRYGDKLITEGDAEKLAARHYERYKSVIDAAVQAFRDEWTEVGNTEWAVQDGRNAKYGY